MADPLNPLIAIELPETRGDGAVSVTMTPQPPAEAEQERTEGERVREFLAEAQKRFHTVADNESRLRATMLEDLRFLSGEHWPEGVKRARELDHRPCLTINRLPQFVRRVTNEMRANRPAIQITPIDSGADVETAEVLQGIVRHIENNSHASVAYETAVEHQAAMGRGWFRVLTEYASDDAFEQEIKIVRVRNPFTIYVDPAAHEYDRADMRFAFVVADLPQDEYKQVYPDSEMASLVEYSSLGDSIADWMPEGSVRVAEYWWVETTEEEVALIQNPMNGQPVVVASAAVPEGVQVLRSRTRQKKTVHWAKINALEILEEGIWPGTRIPIIPVIGDEIDIDGDVDLRGLVRDARDPMRMYDYWVSSQTETIALAPRAPFIGVEGQFEGHESEWKQANVRNFPYLEYRAVSLNGSLAGPPQRQVYEPPIQAIAAATRQADNDLKAVTGFYDASLGERGPEQSGRAILARQRQGDLGSLNYSDNLARALASLGRLLIELIPKVYDTPRVLRILGRDEQQKTVMVHAGQPPDAQPDPGLGLAGIYDISVGRYDVTVSSGPSYASQRQENLAMLMQFVQAAPQYAGVIGDLWAASLDAPIFKQISERLKKTLPPGLADEPGQQQLPPQVMAQMQQAQQVIDALTGQLNEAKEQLQSNALELQTRERIAQINADTQLAIAQSKAASAEQIALLEARMDQIAESINIDLARLGSQTQLQVAGVQAQGQADAAAHNAVAAFAKQAAQHEQELARADQEHQQQLDRQVLDQAHQIDTQALQHQHDLALSDRAHQHAMAEARLQPKPNAAGKPASRKAT